MLQTVLSSLIAIKEIIFKFLELWNVHKRKKEIEKVKETKDDVQKKVANGSKEDIDDLNKKLRF